MLNSSYIHYAVKYSACVWESMEYYASNNEWNTLHMNAKSQHAVHFPFRTGVCVMNSNAKELGLMHSSCEKFLEDRCSVFLSNGTDIDQTLFVISKVAERVHSIVSSQAGGGTKARWCGDALLGIVCNSMYLGCDPASGLPIGLCTDTCLEHLTADDCAPIFYEITNTLNREAIDLATYTNCTAQKVTRGANSSTNTVSICYQGIIIIHILCLLYIIHLCVCLSWLLAHLAQSDHVCV